MAKTLPSLSCLGCWNQKSFPHRCRGSSPAPLPASLPRKRHTTSAPRVTPPSLSYTLPSEVFFPLLQSDASSVLRPANRDATSFAQCANCPWLGGESASPAPGGPPSPSPVSLQPLCLGRGYLYAGLEFGAECYCGHKIQSANTSDSECNMECTGEKSNVCGGPNRLSIYRLELAQESARRCKYRALSMLRAREQQRVPSA